VWIWDGHGIGTVARHESHCHFVGDNDNSRSLYSRRRDILTVKETPESPGLPFAGDEEYGDPRCRQDFRRQRQARVVGVNDAGDHFLALVEGRVAREEGRCVPVAPQAQEDEVEDRYLRAKDRGEFRLVAGGVANVTSHPVNASADF